MDKIVYVWLTVYLLSESDERSQKKNQRLCVWMTRTMVFLAAIENGSGKGFGGKIKRIGFN